MKKIILSVALVSLTFAYAQKKEVTAAFKAIESGNLETANAQIAAAEGIMGDRIYLLEPVNQEQYYYTKGIALIRAGKTSEGAAVLAKIADLGKNKIYVGKNGKEKVFYVGKAAADASGVSGLKEETYVPALTTNIVNTVNPIIQKVNKEAMDAYQAKNYLEAAPKFREVYNLLKAAGQDNKQYLYYSALNYAFSTDKAKAIELYKELIDSGYTGVETNYYAKEKKSGEEVQLNKASWDLMKKAGATGEYSDFRTETTPSIEKDLYETLVQLQIDEKDYDGAIASATKGQEKMPNNTRLGELKGVAYFRAGKTDEFIGTLKEQVAKNPQDKISWYNLGVIASKDPAKKEEAIGYFKKTIEVDPNYASAYQNLAYLEMDLDNDQNYIDQYNNLRKEGKAGEANKVLDARRERFAKALPYAEKWYSIEPKNLDAVGLLKGLYQTTRNEAKFQEMKAKEAELQAAAK